MKPDDIANNLPFDSQYVASQVLKHFADVVNKEEESRRKREEEQRKQFSDREKKAMLVHAAKQVAFEDVIKSIDDNLHLVPLSKGGESFQKAFNNYLETESLAVDNFEVLNLEQIKTIVEQREGKKEELTVIVHSGYDVRAVSPVQQHYSSLPYASETEAQGVFTVGDEHKNNRLLTMVTKKFTELKLVPITYTVYASQNNLPAYNQRQEWSFVGRQTTYSESGYRTYTDTEEWQVEVYGTFALATLLRQKSGNE